MEYTDTNTYDTYEVETEADHREPTFTEEPPANIANGNPLLKKPTGSSTIAVNTQTSNHQEKTDVTNKSFADILKQKAQTESRNTGDTGYSHKFNDSRHKALISNINTQSERKNKTTDKQKDESSFKIQGARRRQRIKWVVASRIVCEGSNMDMVRSLLKHGNDQGVRFTYVRILKYWPARHNGEDATITARLNVPEKDVHTVLDGSFWPPDVIVRVWENKQHTDDNSHDDVYDNNDNHQSWRAWGADNQEETKRDYEGSIRNKKYIRKDKYHRDREYDDNFRHIKDDWWSMSDVRKNVK